MNKLIIIVALSFFLLNLYGAEKIQVDIRDNIVITDEQIEKIKEQARTEYNGQIQRISIGELVKRSGDMGAWVDFDYEIIDTYAIERQIAIEFECKINEKTNPKNGTKEIERLVLDKPFKVGKLRSRVIRVFSLKTGTLYLWLPDYLSYELVASLLESIEEGSYKHAKDDYFISFPMLAIVEVEYSKQDGTISILTNVGRKYDFKIINDGFELTDWGAYLVL